MWKAIAFCFYLLIIYGSFLLTKRLLREQRSGKGEGALNYLFAGFFVVLIGISLAGIYGILS